MPIKNEKDLGNSFISSSAETPERHGFFDINPPALFAFPHSSLAGGVNLFTSYLDSHVQDNSARF